MTAFNFRFTKQPSRILAATMALYFIAFAVTAPRASGQDHSKNDRIDRVSEIGMVVSNMERSIIFYSQVLTFEKISDVEVYGTDYEHLEGLFGVRMRVVRMRLGEEVLELTEFLTPPGRAIPIDSRSNDRWFQHIAIITSDMDAAYKTLRDHNVKHASTAPQTLPEHIRGAAGIRAFYFRDPDNHFLEILQFPPDKGDPKWRKANGKLFLGIDHTAIVVADTQASLQFYRDALGMRIVGESENYGNEQEHLNNVFGARLRITSLHAPSGPGVELLEYLAPRTGRPMPAGSESDDLWAWNTTVSGRNALATEHSLHSRNIEFVSSSVVTLDDSILGFTSGFLVRDPDGHLVRIVQP